MPADSYQVIRAIRGPITLITLGALFALQNFTRFGFDQTWPVLLIVFGLLSLLQRGAAPPRPAPMPPMAPPPPVRGYPTSTGYAGSPYSQPPANTPPASGSSSPTPSSPTAGGAA
jgi:Domain of unknown function (DUF5668)